MVCIMYGLISKQGFESITNDSLSNTQVSKSPHDPHQTVKDPSVEYRKNLKNMIDMCSSESEEESMYDIVKNDIKSKNILNTLKGISSPKKKTIGVKIIPKKKKKTKITNKKEKLIKQLNKNNNNISINMRFFPP